MAEVINMPRLSDTMEEGVVAKWLKKVGDKVEIGDMLDEIEADKATMEFESFNEGVLLHIGIQEGETAPVDTLLAIIGEEGEDISGLLKGGDKSSEKEEKKENKKEESKDEKSEETSGDKKESSEDSKGSSGEIPEGVEVITMPRLSDTMVEGTVAKWLKQEGDKVEEGDILAEIETDKATMEFESFYAGTLLKIGIEEGETAKVDTLLAIIGPEGTDVSGIGGKADAAPLKSKSPSGDDTSSKEETKDRDENESKPAQAQDGSRIFVSPLAKKMAEDKGIDLKEVKGSGENGRIVKKDIESFKPSDRSQTPEAQGAQKEETSTARPYVPAGEEEFEEIKNSQMRKTIAKRLGESKFTAP